LDKLGFNLGFLVVQILAFLIVFVVLKAWAFKPIMNMLEKRRERVAQGLEDARIAAEARANAEREAATVVAEAQSKAAEVMREASTRAESVQREYRAQAEADIAKAREASMAEVEQERNRMLGELRGQVVTLAMAAAQRVIQDSMDEKRQHALLDEFFSGVKNGKVVVLEGKSLAGQAAEVVSALPLNEKEQATVLQEMKSMLGGTPAVNFRVDPAILGGLVVRVGDRVVDGSFAGQLAALRQNLQ